MFKSFLVFLVLAAGILIFLDSNSQQAAACAIDDAIERTDGDSADSEKTTPDNSVVELSVDTIMIVLDDTAPNYLLLNVDRRFDQKGIIKFLTEYYDSLDKTDSKPDLMVSSSTKRLLKGEFEFYDALKLLGEKHEFTIVKMPPPMSRDPHEKLRSFSDDYSAE